MGNKVRFEQHLSSLLIEGVEIPDDQFYTNSSSLHLNQKEIGSLLVCGNRNVLTEEEFEDFYQWLSTDKVCTQIANHINDVVRLHLDNKHLSFEIDKVNNRTLLTSYSLVNIVKTPHYTETLN